MQRVILGVSLSNLVFNRQFARRLADWVGETGAAHLDVVLFDAIEAINYSVFRQLSSEQAQDGALRRAEELSSMFQRFSMNGGINTAIELESRSEIRLSKLFGDVVSDLHSAYNRKGELYRDVRWQVSTNLVERRKKFGDDFVVEHMDTLARYIIEEVAFFYVYFKKYPDAVEVYPGPSLVIKDRFFSGHYRGEARTEPLPPLPRFVDVSFLLSEEATPSPTGHAHLEVVFNQG